MYLSLIIVNLNAQSIAGWFTFLMKTNSAQSERGSEMRYERHASKRNILALFV